MIKDNENHQDPYILTKKNKHSESIIQAFGTFTSLEEELRRKIIYSRFDINDNKFKHGAKNIFVKCEKVIILQI